MVTNKVSGETTTTFSIRIRILWTVLVDFVVSHQHLNAQQMVEKAKGCLLQQATAYLYGRFCPLQNEMRISRNTEWYCSQQRLLGFNLWVWERCIVFRQAQKLEWNRDAGKPSNLESAVGLQRLISSRILCFAKTRVLNQSEPYEQHPLPAPKESKLLNPQPFPLARAAQCKVCRCITSTHAYI